MCQFLRGPTVQKSVCCGVVWGRSPEVLGRGGVVVGVVEVRGGGGLSSNRGFSSAEGPQHICEYLCNLCVNQFAFPVQ